MTVTGRLELARIFVNSCLDGGHYGLEELAIRTVLWDCRTTFTNHFSPHYSLP